MVTDTTQTITTATSQVARWCAVAAGLLGSFLAGILVATSVGDYGVGLSRTGWDLARGGAITCGIIAVLAAMTWWGVEQVVQRLGDKADRNRDATMAMVHRLDQLEVDLPRLLERVRWEGYADAVADLQADPERVVPINRARDNG